MISTTPEVIQQPRIIRLEVINRLKDDDDGGGVVGGKGRGLGVGGGEQLKVVYMRINDTGVEIIEEGHPLIQKSLSDDNLTNVPLHIVKEVQETRTSDKVHDDESGLQRNLLLPIEVGLQLGHDPIIVEGEKAEVVTTIEPRIEAVSGATIVVESVESEAQTENPTARHAEVQTEEEHASSITEENGLEAVSTTTKKAVSVQETSSQTDPLEEKEEEEYERPTRPHSGSRTTVVASPVVLEAEVPRSTSETQTTSIEQLDFSSQTVIIQQTEAITQTEVISEELVFEEEYTEEPREVELETSLPQRPLTLPGCSIDYESPTFGPTGSQTRTRTVSPTSLKVQDDVVARVLLEHLGTVFPDSNPRSAPVNYLDLSRLGEEGETPASDEIWLAVEGSGPSDVEACDEDKFLTTDDTETYSVYTDRMAGVDNSGGGGPTETLLAPSSANLLGSDQELDRLGGASSFDVEAEATARLQGVLASELVPLHNTVQSTDTNVVNLSSRFGNMESLIGTLCSTVENLSGMAQPTRGSGDEIPPDGLAVTEEEGKLQSRGGAISRELSDVKKPDILLLDSLVSRIEHLSSDVQNMDNTRQLREDNLILRKELQTYREREIQMMNRLESLERSLNDIDRDRGQLKSRRGARSRRSSVGSNRSTPELPPIEQPGQRSRSIDPPRSDQVSKPPKLDPADPQKSGSGSDAERPKGPNLDKIVKPPLMNGKSNKKALLRRTSNGSSSSSGNELDVKTISKRKPITPTLEIDYLETEIQVARSDNNILREDIQVYRHREQQLYRRNQELQETVLSLSARNTPTGQKDDKSEMNINVDFVTDEKTGGPKAVFEAKKDQKKGKKAAAAAAIESSSEAETSDSKTAKREQSKDRKSSKENLAVPKNKNGKQNKKAASSTSSSDDENKKKVQLQDDPPKNNTTKDDSKAATGVPKTKNGKNGGKNGNGKPVKKNGKNGKSSGSTSDSAGGKLVDDEEWKVTVTSAHELETTSDSESKTVVVKPKVQEVIKEEAKAAAKAEKKAEKKAKVITKKKDKDIIPKPPMFPAARPPRGYVPPKPVPNASYGMSNVMAPLGPRPGTGRNSSSDNELTHQMLFKQEPRDSLVEASPQPPRTPGPPAPGPLLTDIPYPLTPTRQLPHPPICQVSYDSVFEDPYYSMSYY